ncbi:MAG: DUF4352 domain-containing protein [Clostridium sp.]
MKKTLVLVMATLMTFGVVGCNSNKAKGDETKLEQGVDKVGETAEKVKEDVKAIFFGEMGKSGAFDIKILEVSETDTIKSGVEANDKKIKDKFIVVKLEVKNNTKDAIAYTKSDFVLKNTKDNKEYTRSESSQIANKREIEMNKDLNHIGVDTKIEAETTKNTYIAFEVPKDVAISDTVLINKNAASNDKAVQYKLVK